MIPFLQRILRYGFVGLIVSVVYSLAVILVVGWLPTHDATLASGLVFIALLPIAYLGHRYVSFLDATRDAFQPLRFAITTSSTFLIAIGGMYWVTQILGRSYLFGIALNWALIPAVNFLIFFFWVFRVGRRAVVIAQPEGK
ncbi:MAG TPA: GtrA family protein [Stellaceae bacterium]|nr:GtrA family protein [Stellaceae bacterium]